MSLMYCLRTGPDARLISPLSQVDLMRTTPPKIRTFMYLSRSASQSSKESRPADKVHQCRRTKDDFDLNSMYLPLRAHVSSHRKRFPFPFGLRAYSFTGSLCAVCLPCILPQVRNGAKLRRRRKVRESSIDGSHVASPSTTKVKYTTAAKLRRILKRALEDTPPR